MTDEPRQPAPDATDDAPGPHGLQAEEAAAAAAGPRWTYRLKLADGERRAGVLASARLLSGWGPTLLAAWRRRGLVLEGVSEKEYARIVEELREAGLAVRSARRRVWPDEPVLPGGA